MRESVESPSPAAASPPPAPRHARRRRLAVAAIATLVTLYLAIGAVIAVFMTMPKRRFHQGRDPGTVQLTYQDVRFRARGGDVELAGWYIPHAAGRYAVVMVHGFGSSRTNEYGGKGAQVAAGLYQRGFAVLMIDLRGHGQSGDSRYSFGIHEHRDVEGAVDYLRGQGYPPRSIGVLGVSMGGASSLMATARDEDIGAVVDDSSYADVLPIVRANFRARTGFPAVFMGPTRMWGRIFFGIDIAAARPVDDIAKIAPRPVFIIHSRGDRMIPYAHAEQLKAALPSAELWTLDGAEHAMAYAQDPAAYVDRVATFFQKSLVHP